MTQTTTRVALCHRPGNCGRWKLFGTYATREEAFRAVDLLPDRHPTFMLQDVPAPTHETDPTHAMIAEAARGRMTRPEADDQPNPAVFYTATTREDRPMPKLTAEDVTRLQDLGAGWEDSEATVTINARDAAILGFPVDQEELSGLPLRHASVRGNDLFLATQALQVTAAG